MHEPFEIDGRLVGPGHRPYIIAELSGNHNGDIERCFELIEAAKRAGADAVKLQAYTAHSITVPSSDPEFLIEKGEWAGWNLFDLYAASQTPFEWFPRLFAKGQELGITIFASPFDYAAVDMLEQLNAPAYKIASNELTDWGLIESVARTGKPIILSTGTATLDEIAHTVSFLRETSGSDRFALLHCISAYPAPVEETCLSTITDLARRFSVPTGLSDHTIGSVAAIAATTLQAAIIEKHFIIRRADGGPDSAFSTEPSEFADMVQACHAAHAALGTPTYGMRDAEKLSPIFRRTFYTTREIKAGELLDRDNVRTIRARKGVPAREFRQVYGATAKVDVPAFHPVSWDAIEVPEQVNAT